MKKLLYIWAIALTLIASSCGTTGIVKNNASDRELSKIREQLVKNTDTTSRPCETPEYEGEIPPLEELQIQNRRKARTASSRKAPKGLVVYDRDVIAIKGSEQKANDFIRFDLDRMMKRDSLDGFKTILEGRIMTVAEDQFTGYNTKNLLNKLHEVFPIFPYDFIMYSGYGPPQGLADKVGGAGFPGENYCVSVSLWDSTPYNQEYAGYITLNNLSDRVSGTPSRTLFTSGHEFWHLLNAPHSHACAHTINGVRNRAIDHISQKFVGTAYGNWCTAADIKNPILPEYGTKQSYAPVAGRKYTNEPHEIHKAMREAYELANQSRFGNYNMTYGIRYESGSVKWKDDYFDTWKATAGKFRPGATSYPAWTTIVRELNTEAFCDFKVSQYVSSGTTGARFDSSEDLSQYDTIVIVLPENTGGKWQHSFWNGSKNTGAIDTPADGKIPFPKKFGPAFRLQVRYSKANTPLAYGACAQRTGNIRVDPEYQIPNKTPNTHYVVKLQSVDGGPERTTMIVTEAGIGDTLTDSGGTTGNYGLIDEDYFYPPIVAPEGFRVRLTFKTFTLWSDVNNSDFLEVYNGDDLVAQYHAKKLPPAFLDVDGVVRVRFKCDNSGSYAGYEIPVTAVKK